MICEIEAGMVPELLPLYDPRRRAYVAVLEDQSAAVQRFSKAQDDEELVTAWEALKQSGLRLNIVHDALIG